MEFNFRRNKYLSTLLYEYHSSFLSNMQQFRKQELFLQFSYRSGVSNAEKGSMMWLPAEVGPIHRHFKDSSLYFLNLH